MFSLTEHPRWVHLRKRNFEKLWKHPHISAHWIETPRFDGKFHALSISPSTSSTNPVPHSQYFRPMTHPVLPAGVLHSSAAETTNCLQNNAQNYDLIKTELVRNPFKKKYKSRKYCSQPFLQPGCRYGCVFVFVFVCVRVSLTPHTPILAIPLSTFDSTPNSTAGGDCLQTRLGLEIGDKRQAWHLRLPLSSRPLYWRFLMVAMCTKTNHTVVIMPCMI